MRLLFRSGRQSHAPSPPHFISSFYRDILGALVAVGLSLDVSQFVEADMIAGAIAQQARGLAATQDTSRDSGAAGGE